MRLRFTPLWSLLAFVCFAASVAGARDYEPNSIADIVMYEMFTQQMLFVLVLALVFIFLMAYGGRVAAPCFGTVVAFIIPFGVVDYDEAVGKAGTELGPAALALLALSLLLAIIPSYYSLRSKKKGYAAAPVLYFGMFFSFLFFEHEKMDLELAFRPMLLYLAGIILIVAAIVLVTRAARQLRDKKAELKMEIQKYWMEAFQKRMEHMTEEEKRPMNYCPNCGGPTRFVPEYDAYYCDNCQYYVSPGGKEGDQLNCPRCGGELTYYPENNSFYCQGCGRYVNPFEAEEEEESEFFSIRMICPNCGHAGRMNIDSNALKGSVDVLSRCKECGELNKVVLEK